MDYGQIIALLGALAGPPIDAEDHFGAMATGGHDARAPATLLACPEPVGVDEIEGQTILCGSISVPENHAEPDGRRVDLIFTVMKAKTSAPSPDPLVYLHGGPGLGNMNGIEGLADVFDPWRRTRDVITFDQRAAGLSSKSATCSEAITGHIADLVADDLNDNLLIACIEELRGGEIGLEHYNTTANALDVSMVMSTLGYESYNIYGISYGTKLALEVMRSAPEGVRSVILDGVAPQWLPLYDTLAQPMSDAMVALVDECTADAACNAAYPDLGAVLSDTLARAAAGELVQPNGVSVTPATILEMFRQRPEQRGSPSLTPYMPAMIYEFARSDQPTPTIDRVYVEHGFKLPHDPVGDLRRSVQVLDPETSTLLELAVSEAERIRDTDHELDLTIHGLRDAIRRERSQGPLAALLDRELSRASGEMLGDIAAVTSTVEDFAEVMRGVPSKAALRDFVGRHFAGVAADRLTALIGAMSEREVAAFFEAASRSIRTTTFHFVTTADLWIYACQEDWPFNSIDGYRAHTAALEYPLAGVNFETSAVAMDGICQFFEQSPREGFQTVVESDIPTLAFGGTWDLQTSWRWAEESIRGLSNAQSFVIPETGHGSVLFARCVGDMGVAFVNDPTRQFDNSCAESLKPQFYIAPWVQLAASDRAEASEAEGPAEAASVVVSPSFDCGAAQSEAEKLVCKDADLAVLDNRLAQRFAASVAAAETLDAGAADAVSTLRAFQRGWLSGRDECWKATDLRACVEDAYLRREGQLVAEWLLEEPTSVTSYACEGNPANEVTVYAFATERPSVRIEYGDSVDFGSLVPSASGSRYEASFGHSVWLKGDEARLVWPEGNKMTCEVAQ